ncbi:BadF/BadG/BcrA/BcrD ATPase family protein [Hydrogenimonas urashimensis]|uniref:BadF/BadG/BcrA/BcrD ATPase family protein n=1 Tax=Hydrogenimonas urashimensis TaxID=2740515 RepID=UPI001916916A|nr:BadF/BadG/BcrA/BcrD ATPase family protein [Hydrogenimonas urashimensis]
MKRSVRYRLGIDVGSTTVKYVVCDDDLDIVEKEYTPHETRQAAKLLELLSGLARRRPEIFERIDSAHITGSGAAPLTEPLGAGFVQEVNAVVLAVEHFHPNVRSIVELGGQDAKIIHFREADDGTRSIITSMNDKCASGTGATIEKCTLKIGMPSGRLHNLQFDPEKLHHVAAKCGVFAETDIVNLLKNSIPPEEIMNSLADAIVMQNLTVLTRGNTLLPDVLLLGGPNTYLPFLQACWRYRIAELWRERGIPCDPEELEERIIVPENAQYYAAFGAILHGFRQKAPAFRGLGMLETAVRRYTSVRRPGSGAPLAESAEELEAFRKKYELPQPSFTAPGEKKACWLGIDGGSTSSKAVVCDQRGEILFKAYRLSGGNPIEDILFLLRQIRDFDSHGRLEIRGFGVTGYAADVLESALGADVNIIETVAHMRSAQSIFGEDVDVICDVGGQDIKVLFLENGMLKNFRLSNQCSAGNGMLLQSMAKQFGVPMERFADVAFKATQTPRFNYGCAVFLDTDRVNFQKEGYTKEELFAGIAKVLPKNIWQYVVQSSNLARLGRRFVLQGGTQRNLAALKAQVDYIERKVPGAEVLLHPHCAEAGAHGAAIEAIRRTLERGHSLFVGLEKALKLTYTTRTDEETRCRFCPNHCARTFVDTRIPGSDPVRYIAGFACEKGTVESPEALKALETKRKALQRFVPNLVRTDATRLFETAFSKASGESQMPPEGERISSRLCLPLFGTSWSPVLHLSLSRRFRRAAPEARRRRRKVVVGIPRVLNLYNAAPLLVSYLTALGVPPRQILFSDFTSEKRYLEGARQGSVDACFPAKAALAHLHSLLFAPKFRTKGITHIWFPSIVSLPSRISHAMGHAACPVVTGTPKVVYSALVKERDIFEEKKIRYLDVALDLAEPELVARQLYKLWKEPLGITRDENDWAVRHAYERLEAFEKQMQEEGKRILESAEREGRVVLLILGRPYHADPGLNHDIPEMFQSLGYPVLSMRSIPKDPLWLHRWFAEEIAAGLVADCFDIRDVWPENFSANSAQKVWAAKFAARHPNVAVVDLSSFKCGHDAPIYAIIDKILGASRTPHLALHDIDANKPGGSINIRIKTFAYTLEEYRRQLVKAHVTFHEKAEA